MCWIEVDEFMSFVAKKKRVIGTSLVAALLFMPTVGLMVMQPNAAYAESANGGLAEFLARLKKKKGQTKSNRMQSKKIRQRISIVIMSFRM